MRIITCVKLVAALALAFLPAAVRAGTATTTFTVTATVASTCSITATNIAFGTYTGTAISTTGSVTVTCTNTTAYNVGLSAGMATGATVTTRKMTLNSATLSYSLTQDSAHATNWGVTVGTDTVAGTGNGAAQTLTVYALLAGGQLVAPGTYTDTITATVSY